MAGQGVSSPPGGSHALWLFASWNRGKRPLARSVPQVAGFRCTAEANGILVSGVWCLPRLSQPRYGRTRYRAGLSVCFGAPSSQQVSLRERLRRPCANIFCSGCYFAQSQCLQLCDSWYPCTRTGARRGILAGAVKLRTGGRGSTWRLFLQRAAIIQQKKLEYWKSWVDIHL